MDLSAHGNANHWCPAFLDSHHPSAVSKETEPAEPLTVCEFQRPSGFHATLAEAAAPTNTCWPGTSSYVTEFSSETELTLTVYSLHTYTTTLINAVGSGRRFLWGNSIKLRPEWRQSGSKERLRNQELVVGQRGRQTLSYCSYACQAFEVKCMQFTLIVADWTLNVSGLWNNESLISDKCRQSKVCSCWLIDINTMN